MQGKVEITGVNTAKLRVLKSSETAELLRRSKCRDKQAREAPLEGQSAAGAVCDSALYKSGRERGRSFSGGLCGAHQGH